MAYRDYWVTSMISSQIDQALNILTWSKGVILNAIDSRNIHLESVTLLTLE